LVDLLGGLIVAKDIVLRLTTLRTGYRFKYIQTHAVCHEIIDRINQQDGHTIYRINIKTIIANFTSLIDLPLMTFVKLFPQVPLQSGLS